MTDVTVMVRPAAGADSQGEAGSGPYEFLLGYRPEEHGIWRTTRLIWPPDISDWKGVEGFQQEVHDDLRGAMKGIQNNPAAKVLSRVRLQGMRLWKVLMPVEIQQALGAAYSAAHSAGGAEPPILRIHTNTAWIPWEIMHDGTEFLGVRFQVARLPIVNRGPDLSNGQRRTVRTIYSLLGENVLQGAQQEGWKNTFVPVAGGNPHVQVVTFPSAPAWDIYPTVDTLFDLDQPDILHITCHGPGESQETRTFWTLNEGQPAESRIDKALVGELGGVLGDARTLVFGNACASVGANVDALSVSGFGSEFFKQGALAFIGTFAPVSKAVAVEFAQEFYARLLGGPGMAVGKALCETKQHFRQKAGQNDPSYLFYCLHGPPETQFALATD